MFMQFDVELSFEITNPKCNGHILMLLSMIFKIKCMHSLKHFFFLEGGILRVFTQCAGYLQPVVEISLLTWEEFLRHCCEITEKYWRYEYVRWPNE